MVSKVAPTVSETEQINNVLSSYVGKSDKLALLLDYDGTLSAIAPHPLLATTVPASEAALNNLVTYPNVYTSILSGRSADNAREKVKLSNITYAGNHGLEIVFPNGTRYHHQIDPELLRSYERMVTELESKLAGNGAWIENKKHSLTVHYRSVPEPEHPAFKARAISIIEAHGYTANQAHCAVEAKPPVVWNKGEAAKHILRQEFGDDWSQEVKVIFIGDDTTDEDAMKALKGAGLSFRVSANPEIETNADYRIPSTDTVATILQWLQDNLK